MPKIRQKRKELVGRMGKAALFEPLAEIVASDYCPNGIREWTVKAGWSAAKYL